jgi:EAL domain-containing protein (putative c-di-GMP-specific phosphodiesterase class I)/CheY-like chemotaxis protein
MPRAFPAPPSCVVIDDDVAVCATIATLLQDRGCQVTTFNTIAELVRARPLQVDLVIADLSLRGSDAVEVLRCLREDGFSGAVALMSGHEARTIDQVQRIGKTYGLDMKPFLCKPIRGRDIASLLHSVRAAPTAAIGLRGDEEAKVRRHSRRTFQLALERGQVELWYQPQISLHTGVIEGFEALARVRHPRRGVLLPGQFLPRAGDPLLVELASFAVSQALADNVAMSAEGMAARISVNVPLIALRNTHFLSDMRDKLGNHPRAIQFVAEITEDEALHETAAAVEAATQLHLMNVQLSIDDFGTGYSSLARICDLPFSEVKIDRAFVSGCASDRLRQAICRTVIDLARRFDAVVVAEGIETVADLNMLVELGCDFGQGFLIGRPLPLSETIAAHRNGFLAANDVGTLLSRKLRRVARHP